MIDTFGLQVIKCSQDRIITIVSALIDGISYTYDSQGLWTQAIIEDSTEVLDTIQYT